MLESLTPQLQAKTDLSEDQVALAVADLVDEHVPAEAKAAFLISLAEKGETAGEITAFAAVLRDKSVRPPIDEPTRARGIVDVCGTGGDRLHTFNISTTVALVVAAAGVPVAKHGNRAVTSLCGSADVLETLGVPIELGPEEAAHWLREHDFAFFFAPRYHPAFKHIGPARKLCAERGGRTIFNFLGPLLNPARPAAQLVGVSDPRLCEPMARALRGLGVRRGLVASGCVGERYLDELSTLGTNHVVEFVDAGELSSSEIPVGTFPVEEATLEQLAGGTAAENAVLVRRLVSGEERGPRLDAVLLNAAAALYVAGKARSMSEGWNQAAELIASGKAREKLAELVRAGAARK